jgi:isopenicillin-N N-acyltransferase-like protein
MQAIEQDPFELVGTRVRYFRAMRLLKDTEKHTIKSLQAILRDHINFPSAICNHIDAESDPLDREKTINSMVMDLTAGVMHLAWGNPCQNRYHTFHLEG